MNHRATDFWLAWGKTYKEQFDAALESRGQAFALQEQMLLDYLSGLKLDSVLEVGCGFGRITKLVMERFNPKEYIAIDLSPDQLENARKYVNDDRVEFFNYSIEEFRCFPEKFDLVLACEVLMHIPPEDIVAVMYKMAMLARKGGQIVHVDWYQQPVPQIAKDNFCFVHDYEKIYGPDWTVKRIEIGDIRQSIFHAQLSKRI